MVLKKELKYPMSAVSRTALITKGLGRKSIQEGRESGCMNKYVYIYVYSYVHVWCAYEYA